MTSEYVVSWTKYSDKEKPIWILKAGIHNNIPLFSFYKYI